MKSLKRKFVITFVSFALAFVALHPILNFHFYRIFNQELAKVENNFIKKEDSYLHITSIDKDLLDHCNIFLTAFINQDLLLCLPKTSYIIQRNIFHKNNTFALQSVEISPTRGSPTLL